MLPFCFAYGQTNDVTKHLTGIQQDSLFSIKLKKEQDSLRTEFYKQPKVIKLTFEKDGRAKPFIGQFFIWINGEEFELKPNTLGFYAVDLELDHAEPLMLKITNGKNILVQPLLNPSEIKNGADIVYGVITNIQKQTKKAIKKLSEKDHELSPKHEFYNAILDDETLLDLALQNKIKRVEYLQVTPIVFGCGTSNRYINY